MRILLYLMLVCLPCFAQQDTLQVTKIKEELLAVDHFWGEDTFDYQYSSNNNTLYKIGSQQKFQYKNVGLGTIFSLDILNPLELTLFYRDFNTVVKLDNNLNEIITINFMKLAEFKNISFASTGIEQHLWIFNSDTQQLELFNYNTKRSKIIGQAIQETVIDMKSDYNFCWLLSTEFVYKFNNYGTLLQRIPVKNGKQLAINNENLVIVTQDKISFLPKKTETIKTINLSNKFKGDVLLTNDYLYIYANDFLTSYKLQPLKK